MTNKDSDIRIRKEENDKEREMISFVPRLSQPYDYFMS